MDPGQTNYKKRNYAETLNRRVHNKKFVYKRHPARKVLGGGNTMVRNCSEKKCSDFSGEQLSLVEIPDSEPDVRHD